jgi:hypothetical protein
MNFRFSLMGTLILSLTVYLLLHGLRGCNSDDLEFNDASTNAFIERESDRLANEFDRRYSGY